MALNKILALIALVLMLDAIGATTPPDPDEMLTASEEMSTANVSWPQSTGAGCFDGDPTSLWNPLAGGQVSPARSCSIADQGARSTTELQGFDAWEFQEVFQEVLSPRFTEGHTVVADFDRDGDQDIAMLLGLSGGDWSPLVRLLSAIGNSSFDSSVVLARPEGAMYPSDLAKGDFDGDGWTDLVVALGNETVVALNDRAGSFFEISLPNVTSDAVAVGDVNGDGNDDILVGAATWYQGTRVHVLQNDGDGHSFTHSWSSPLIGYGVTYMRDVRFGDLDGDGHLDIVGAAIQGSFVFTYLGDGSGYSFRQGDLIPMATAFSMDVGDVNRDSRDDVVYVGCNGYWECNVVVLTTFADGSLGEHSWTGPPLPGGVWTLQLVDFDLDGYLDIFAPFYFGDVWPRIYRSASPDGDRFEEVWSGPILPFGIAADLDGDRLPDLVTGYSSLAIYRNASIVSSEPNPRANGYYMRLCLGPHSGDELTDADATCVGEVTQTFAGISTVAQLCEVIGPSQPNGDACDRTEDDLMVLALNICRRRVSVAQSIDSECGGNGTVGQSLAESDAILFDSSRDADTCAHAKCLDEEINTGRALELNSLRLRLEGGGVRLDWSSPNLDDGTGHPRTYHIWRRAQGALSPFAKIGDSTEPTYLDTSSGTGAFEYEVTSVMD